MQALILIDDAISKNTKRASARGISVLKDKVVNFKFFILASWGVFACRVVVSMQRFFVQFYQFKNVNALIARELSGFTGTRSQTINSKFSIQHSGGIEISRSLLVNSCR